MFFLCFFDQATFDRELQRACAIKGMAKGDSSGGGPRRASIAAVKTRRASAAPTGMSFDAAASIIAPGDHLNSL